VTRQSRPGPQPVLGGDVEEVPTEQEVGGVGGVDGADGEHVGDHRDVVLRDLQ